jgi:hypothetical protein
MNNILVTLRRKILFSVLLVLFALAVPLRLVVPIVYAQTLKISNVNYPNQVVANSLQRYRVTASIDWHTGSDDHYLWAGLGEFQYRCLVYFTYGCPILYGHVEFSPQPCWIQFGNFFSVVGQPTNPDQKWTECIVNLPESSSGTEAVVFDFVTYANGHLVEVGSQVLQIWTTLSQSQGQIVTPAQGIRYYDAYNITLQVVAAAPTTTSNSEVTEASSTSPIASSTTSFLQANAEWLAPVGIIVILAVGFLVFRIAKRTKTG